jgi:predicted dehydrogenase
VKPVRVGLVGAGKIARDQHIPAMAASDAFELVACASLHHPVEGVANFASIEAMLESGPALDAVAVCTPPQAHYEIVKAALAANKHVLLEKPPTVTLAQLDHLKTLADQARRTLYQTWHSRHAPSVAEARKWLASRKIIAGSIIWKEDVRYWHPGQHWIWEAGGFGVFDPGINALSILTQIVPEPVFVETAQLQIPENLQSPLAADLALTLAGGARIAAGFDFRHTGPQTWDIDIQTDGGMLKLSAGGAALHIDDAPVRTSGSDDLHCEYKSIYERFAELIAQGQSEVDARPFQLVADAFLIGSRRTVEAFVE